MAIQTSFAEKVTWSQDCNHRFLALLGNDGELDLALLDVKNRVRDLSLRKNNLILPIFGYRFSLAHLGEKYFWIKRGFSSLPHKGLPFFFLTRAALSADEGRAKQVDYSAFQYGKSRVGWHYRRGIGRINHAATTLARNSSSQVATLRLRRKESLPGAFRIMLCAMCLRVVKLAGALSVRMRHSSSRKTMSITQCRLFSIAQWLRTIGPSWRASHTREVM